MASKRIQKEIEVLRKENHLVKFKQNGLSYTIQAVLYGPEDTVFENAVYLISFEVDGSTYPFKPPEVEFRSQIYHPNISDPSICIDTLNDNWSSANTLFSVIKSLESLLAILMFPYL